MCCKNLAKDFLSLQYIHAFIDEKKELKGKIITL